MGLEVGRLLFWVYDSRFGSLGSYLNLPNPTFLSALIRNPNMEFIGTLQKSRFW